MMAGIRSYNSNDERRIGASRRENLGLDIVDLSISSRAGVHPIHERGVAAMEAFANRWR
jgi:hypothetical protein